MPNSRLTPIHTLVECADSIPEIHRRILKELGKIEYEMSQCPQDGDVWNQLIIAQQALAWVENPEVAGPPTKSIERKRYGQS